MDALKVTSTPTKLPMTSQRARLGSRPPNSEVGIVCNPGKLNTKLDYIRVDIDTSRSRDSLGPKTARGLIEGAANASLRAASDVTAQYFRVGNQMMQIQDGMTVSGVIKNQMVAQTNVVTGTAPIPSVGPDTPWEPADLLISFAPAQFAFDPQMQESATRYIPGEPSVNVEQYPKIGIEYMEDPIYIPSSADPAGNGGPQ